jgi:predicted phosphodiesterase
MKKNICMLLIFVQFCTSSLLFAEPIPGFKTAPYLQNHSQESVTIMWHSEKPAYGWIEYGTSEQLGKTADMVVDGLKSANTTTHKIPLEVLEPGETYYYRACIKPIVEFHPYSVVFDDVIYSETRTFSTVPESDSNVTFAIFNDLHNNYAMFDSLRTVIEHRDYQFSIFNGDCFSDPQSEDDVIKALSIYNEGVSAGSHPPVFMRGNHETRGKYARDLKKNFDFPESEFYFAMTAGPIRFVFLDCGEDKTDDHAEYSGLTDFSGYRERQKEWLNSEVSSVAFQETKYRILVHHIPLYNHNSRGISKLSRALWESVLDEMPIDIAINGHTHRPNFVPVQTDGNNYPGLIGGGSRNGTVMILSASNEKLSIEVLNTKGETIALYEKPANGEFTVIR